MPDASMMQHAFVARCQLCQKKMAEIATLGPPDAAAQAYCYCTLDLKLAHQYR